MTDYLAADRSYQTTSMNDIWAQQVKEDRIARGEKVYEIDAKKLAANKEKFSKIAQNMTEMSGQDWLLISLTSITNKLPDDENTKNNMLDDTLKIATMQSLKNIDGNVVNLTKMSEKSISMDANQYVGQKVEVEFNKFRHKDGEMSELGYDLPYNAHTVTISIFDEKARQVRTLELKHGKLMTINGKEEKIDLRAGRKSFQWDGSDNLGKKVEDGQFKFQVRAYDKSGDPLKIPTTGELIKIKHFTSGILESNEFDGNLRTATVNGIEIPADNIKSFSVDRHQKISKTPEQLGAETKALMEKETAKALNDTDGTGIAEA